MLRLTQAPDIALATLWLDILREAGIEAVLLRQHLVAAAGTLPPDQCLPELWLKHAEQEAPARALLQALQELPQRRWRCPACAEWEEGGFEQCWQCGAAMPP